MWSGKLKSNKIKGISKLLIWLEMEYELIIDWLKAEKEKETETETENEKGGWENKRVNLKKKKKRGWQRIKKIDWQWVKVRESERERKGETE